ncbi:hypothetical protein ACWEN6_36240 [Sphaerisporangium sp. NPDC004334]
MDWVPLVSTVAGAAIALAGTVLADTLRRRDERGRSWRSDRRQCYLEFVTAVNAAHGLLRGAASDDPQSNIHRATNKAINDSQIYRAREIFLVTAEPSVAGAGEITFKRLMAIRDAVRSGTKPGSEEFHDLYTISPKPYGG